MFENPFVDLIFDCKTRRKFLVHLFVKNHNFLISTGRIEDDQLLIEPSVSIFKGNFRWARLDGDRFQTFRVDLSEEFPGTANFNKFYEVPLISGKNLPRPQKLFEFQLENEDFDQVIVSFWMLSTIKHKNLEFTTLLA
jgi:hypothetical protein